MNTRTLIILLGVSIVLVTAYVVLKLARPCDGKYEFSLREGKFVCYSTERDEGISDENGKPKSVSPKEDPCNAPWQERPLDCAL